MTTSALFEPTTDAPSPDTSPMSASNSSASLVESSSAEADVEKTDGRPRMNSPSSPALPLKKLPPKARVRAVLGLVLILFFGSLLLLFVWIGARITRRSIQREDKSQARLKRPSLDEDDWARKPLVPREPFEDE